MKKTFNLFYGGIWVIFLTYGKIAEMKKSFNKRGQTDLHRMMKAGSFATLRTYLEDHPDKVTHMLNALDDDGRTIYDLYYQLGHHLHKDPEAHALGMQLTMMNAKTSLSLALERKEIDAHDLDQGLLWAASENKATEVILYLIAGANPSVMDYKCAPLHYAAFYQNQVMVDYLKVYGASINQRDHDGLTPLDAALRAYEGLVIFNTDLQKLSALLGPKALTGYALSLKVRAFFSQVLEGHLGHDHLGEPIVDQIEISEKGVLSARTKKLITPYINKPVGAKAMPLIFQAMDTPGLEDIEIIRVLKELGCDVNIRAGDDHVMIYQKMLESNYRREERRALFQLLLSAGLDLDAVNHQGVTVRRDIADKDLEYARWLKHYEAGVQYAEARVLEDHLAIINAKTADVFLANDHHLLYRAAELRLFSYAVAQLKDQMTDALFLDRKGHHLPLLNVLVMHGQAEMVMREDLWLCRAEMLKEVILHLPKDMRQKYQNDCFDIVEQVIKASAKLRQEQLVKTNNPFKIKKNMP